jgi:hypothetical protein
MERLTFEGNFCDIAQCRELPCKYDGNCSQKQVWERLKAYEDTGLEPEEVLPKDKADEIALKLMRLADLESICNYTRLRELAEADKDGRVVVLPCRQGDELWTYCNHPVNRVYSFTVSDVSTLNGRTVLNTLGLGTIRPEDIGKTVFLTREEAERAIQEMEGKKDGNETSM